MAGPDTLVIGSSDTAKKALKVRLIKDDVTGGNSQHEPMTYQVYGHYFAI